MKAIVQDSVVLETLKPLEVAGYLRASGWHLQQEFDGKIGLWLKRDPLGNEADITLPLRRELGDFTLRMAEVLKALAEVEQRSQLDVLRDLLTTTSDLIRVRVPSNDSTDGTLAMEKAVVFVESSQELMLASACAAFDKRAVFSTRKPGQAMDYVSRLRMGQTEQGSYVLTILSPVTPELRPMDLFSNEPPEPFARRVTRTLLQALSKLASAARHAGADGNMQSFGDAVQFGVSANLCEAVVALSRISGDVDVTVAWSRTRPRSAADDIGPSRVLLGIDSIPIIEEASRWFRQSTPLEDFEVNGIVTRLSRAEGDTKGEVTITGYVEDQVRKVVVELEDPDYSKAVHAHDERRLVSCVGDLEKEGRSYRLKRPRQFRVLDAEGSIQ